jgi:hypothetical protein
MAHVFASKSIADAAAGMAAGMAAVLTFMMCKEPG